MKRFLLLALLLCAAAAPAQLRVTGTFKNFRFPDYYPDPPPGQTNRPLRTLLQGEEARQVARDKISITGLRIEYYRPDGAIEAVVRASDCLFEVTNRVAHGAGPLSAGSLSNLFSIEGEGFLWRQQDFWLIISNRVVTRFDRSLLGTNRQGGFSLPMLPAAPLAVSTGATLTVRSDQCVFEGHSNRVTQSGHVTIEDPEVRLSCENLEVRFTPARRLRDIAVRGGVSVVSKADGSRLEAGEAVYRADPGRETLDITGQPVWRDAQGRQELRAGQFRADFSQRTLYAESNAVLLLAQEALTHPDLTLGAGLPVTLPPARPGVQDTNQIRITARQMRVLLPGPDRPGRHAIAEGDVVITGEAGQLRGTADRLDLKEAEGRMTMEGRVVWTAGTRQVRADRLTLDQTNRTIHGQGQVAFRVPMGSAAPSALPAAASTNLVLELLSRAFTLQSNSLTCLGEPVHARLLDGPTLLGRLTSPTLVVRFSNRLDNVVASGGVQAEHYPPPNTNAVATNLLACETLAVKFSADGQIVALVASENVQAAQISVSNSPPKTTLTELTCGVLTAVLLPKAGRVDKLHAERNVVLVQDDKMGRADQAIYTDEAYRLVLSGRPYAEYSQGRIRDADTLIWDRATGKVSGLGRYQIEWRPPAGRTNPVPLFFPRFLP